MAAPGNWHIPCKVCSTCAPAVLGCVVREELSVVLKLEELVPELKLRRLGLVAAYLVTLATLASIAVAAGLR